MRIGIPKEHGILENRVAGTPDVLKKWIKRGFEVWVESSAGDRAGFSNSDYENAGVKIASKAADVFSSKIIFKVVPPNLNEISLMKPESILLSFLEPYKEENALENLARASVSAFAMELIPRTTRAQSMDALSSQANIAGYRAVLEAATHYPRFCAMMMTSAGMSKPARALILGAGVAGLQAIASVKRLGAATEAFDVRSEVREQIQSLGAKFVEIDLKEEGSGVGGYAKELSEAAKQRLLDALAEKIKKSDIVISTANIPGRKAPLLISEEAVKGMRTGSVIIDMAAASGGNCVLTEADKIVKKFGVTLVGLTNYPSLMPADSSQFFSNNLSNLLQLLVKDESGKPKLEIPLEDDIVSASLVCHEGKTRWTKK